MTLEDNETAYKHVKKAHPLIHLAAAFADRFCHDCEPHFLAANAVLQELVGLCLARLPPEAREKSKRDLFSVMRDVGDEVYEDEKDWMSRRMEKEEQRHRTMLNKLLKKEGT